MKRAGFGVIGVGIQGERHAAAYAKHPLSKLVAVADIDRSRAEYIARVYGAEAYFTDYHKLLEMDEIEAVSIVTPDFLHRDPCIAAAEAGKHVLVEKPMATSVDDCLAMIDACRRAGVKLMVAFHNRWNPVFVQTKHSVSNGDLGKLIYAYARLNDTIYVPTKMLPWASRSSSLWFLGSHTIDLLLWLFEEKPFKVYGFQRSVKLRSMGIDTPDLYGYILHFRDAVAFGENLWILPDGSPTIAEFKLELVGDKGCIYTDHSRGRSIEKVTDKYSIPDTYVYYNLYGKPSGFTVECVNHFIECVVEDREPMVRGEDGLAVTTVISSILESLKKSGEIYLS
ncbi:MAG: Gfo/Idh/MocA family oxidoreductase [Nitrososphaerota archaeon]|nr:Gfo/Idh/MocA family oxidoreductase [Candidatus Bathyarchaeota archaeon]MCX8162623.1 Gfo/Idh/MocA family oxidoreductase [Candidatus Bathyarchaeota archaeon]MDW8061145.1 Gfo/Idh/MocA family oxidoreductase [Nitrososphaerota archaeon]